MILVAVALAGVASGGVAYADSVDVGFYDPAGGRIDEIVLPEATCHDPFFIDVGVLLNDTGDSLELGGYEMDIVDDSANFGSTALPGVTLISRTVLSTGWLDATLTPSPIDLWTTALDSAAAAWDAGSQLAPGGEYHLERLELVVPASVPWDQIDYWLVVLDKGRDPNLVFAAPDGVTEFDIGQLHALHILPEPASLACFSALFAVSLLRRRRR